MKWTLCILLCCANLLTLTSQAHANSSITVFAAASLRGVLEDVAQDFSTEVRFSYGGSGAMARQVALGAPADLVILANPVWMNWLETRNAIRVDTRQDVLRNRLVLIGPADAAPLTDPDAAMLLSTLDGGRLAIGQRDAVPAGQYARAWLEDIDAWAALSPHLAETDNVRAALALVALHETPLGVVYASDALAEPRVSILWNIPKTTHPEILYPAAAITDIGETFLDHLLSSQAQIIFQNHGFLPVGETG